MNTTGPDANADDSLRYVFIQRIIVQCPGCHSTDLKTLRSKTDKSDGSVSRRTLCKACGHRFFVIVE
jgi:hypothetical protein